MDLSSGGKNNQLPKPHSYGPGDATPPSKKAEFLSHEILGGR